LLLLDDGYGKRLGKKKRSRKCLHQRKKTDARGWSSKSGEHFETISLGRKNAKIFKIILLSFIK
jgi:hypothetical protein